MPELWIQKLALDDAGHETLAETRDRLRAHFSPLALRRMTQLGMLVGGTLRAIEAEAPAVVVYATSYGESRALEAYLDSFPSPSPTLFQTSIHPSGAQQGLIGRQQPVRELYPLSGGSYLGGQALATAALCDAPEIVVCGGEERGTYLLEHGVASDRSFGFAMLLTREAGERALGCIDVATADARAGIALTAWFDLLRNRLPFDGDIAPGWRARLSWQ